MTDENGGFEDVRESVDGHPMWNLLGYARPYWLRISLGVLAAIGTRFARLVPPIIVATAIDRVVLGSGEPGLLTRAGLVPGGELVELDFLHRTQYDEIPPRVEYEATEQLLALRPTFQELSDWMDRYGSEPLYRGDC